MAVLAYLASARPRGFHRRDKIAALFWPELDDERARSSLRTTLTRIRDDLGADVFEARGADEIAVNRDLVWCDAAALHAYLAVDDIASAIDLYRGPFLDGVHVAGGATELEQWISEERAAIRTGLLTAASTHIDRFAAAGEWAKAVALAQRACVIAPEDESAARRLIRVALGGGDRGTALRAYDEIERTLQREYGVAPSDETTALLASLRRAGGRLEAGLNGAKNGGGNGAAISTSHSAGSPFTGQTRDAPASVASRGAVWRRRAAAIAAGVVVIAATWRVARLGMSPDAGAQAPTGSWRQFVPHAGVPSARHHGRVALDSTGDGLLALGGAHAASERLPSAAGDRQKLEPIGNEVWRLIGLQAGSLPQWVRVAIRVGPAPKPRWMFGAAYDASADRWFVHGGALGWTSPCSNDTWVLDRASGLTGQPVWRAVVARGTPPEPRSAFELTLDRNRRKLIVFGGSDCINSYFNDTWVLAFDDSTLSTGAWTRLRPDSSEGQPVIRSGHSSVYDSAAARLYVYGGNSAQSRATSDLWVLEHADGASGAPRWHQLNCVGDAPPLVGAASAYDAVRDSWMFVGGSDDQGVTRRELWRVDGLMRSAHSCRWTQIAFSEPWPLPRSAAAGVMLRGGNAFVIFGGHVENFSLRDAWAYAVGARR